MFPEITELIGDSIEWIWIPRTKSNTVTPKTPTRKHADQGKFHTWMTTNCSEVMSKRTQQDSEKKGVMTKSKPMMNSVSPCSERTLYVLASTASESPGKTWHESQLLLSSRTEQHQRTWRLVEDAYSSSYSEWTVELYWSSQEWKSDELMEVWTGRLVYEQPPGEFTEYTDKFIVDDDDMNPDTVAESDMSSISRSFFHRVNDRSRKIQDQFSKDPAQDSNKHFSMWRMFVFDTKNICIHGKELLGKFTFHQEYRKRSHNESDVRHVWKVDSRTVRWDLWSEHN